MASPRARPVDGKEMSAAKGRRGTATAGGSGAVPLSERERRFVDAYMTLDGNATKAAIAAGYSAKSARHQASRLLTKRNIRAAIDQRATSDPAVWTRGQRQRFWTAVASGAKGFKLASLRDRLRATELLGKSQADFVDRHQFEDADGVPLIVKLLAGHDTQAKDDQVKGQMR
jgi:phage terminase small subunit